MDKVWGHGSSPTPDSRDYGECLLDGIVSDRDLSEEIYRTGVPAPMTLKRPYSD